MPNNVGEWEFPPGHAGTQSVAAEPALVGIPTRLLENFRNFGIEVVFTGLTAADVGTIIHIRVGHEKAAVSVGDPIEITQDVVDSTEHTFFRQFVNMDVKKMAVDFSLHQAGTTAHYQMTVFAGGKRE